VLFTEAANVFINHLDRPDLAVKLAGDNTGWLSEVAKLLSKTEGQQLLAEQARARVVELLKLKCQQPDAPAWAFASLAGICARENDNGAAIENYRRALVLDYGQVQWRFTLATLLAKTERIPEAIHEARICLRLRPEFTVAKKFIADLSVHPAPLGKEDQTDVSGEQEDVSSSKK
jgi:tetratricopeptide (TPR) repeat protein